MYHSRN